MMEVEIQVQIGLLLLLLLMLLLLLLLFQRAGMHPGRVSAVAAVLLLGG